MSSDRALHQNSRCKEDESLQYVLRHLGPKVDLSLSRVAIACCILEAALGLQGK